MIYKYLGTHSQVFFIFNIYNNLFINVYMNHIKIVQDNRVTEYSSVAIIEKIYQLFTGESIPVNSLDGILDELSELEGNITVTGIFKFVYDWLTTKFPNLRINYSEQFLYIKDPYIESVLLENNFGDSTNSHVSYAKAFAASSLPRFGSYVNNQTYEENITSFNELSEFTNVKKLTDNFSRCANLESVDLKNVTELAATFYWSGIKHCLNSGNVEIIGGQCFENCKQLETFDFSSVRCIGWNAVNGTKLTEIHFGGWEEIDLRNSSVINNSYLHTIDGLENLTELKYDAIFTGNSALIELRFDNLIAICNGEFQNCSSLETFYAPLLHNDPSLHDRYSNSNDGLGNNTFYRCYKLKNLTLDWEHITKIGNHFFDDCNELETIDISNVTEIYGDYVFNKCKKLKNLGNNNILHEDLKQLPAAVFKNCEELQTIDISNVEILQNEAFYECKKLETIGSFESLKKIYGSSHFRRCALLNIDADFSGVEKTYQNNSSNINNDNATIPPYIFMESGIKSFKGNEYFTTIGREAFHKCSSFKSFTNCPNITLVDEFAFEECTNTNFTSINLPNVIEIKSNAFWGDRNLTTIGVCKPKIIGNSAFRRTAVNIDLSECTSLGDWVFAENTGLGPTVDLHSLTTLTGQFQFYKCTKINDVIYSNNESITNIPKGCFQEASITEITLGSNIKTIEDMAFYLCEDFRTINSNNFKPTSIGDAACRRTGVNIDLSECITLKNWAFGENEAIGPNIDLHSLTTLTGENNFVNCINIVTINFNNNIERITKSCFQGCTKLESITLSSNTKTIGASAFYNCSKLNTIDLSNIETIENNGFYGCSKLLNINNTNKLKSIGTYAFAGHGASAEHFTSINLENVETIGERAFHSCTPISSPIILNKIKSFGTEVFVGCSNIPYIVINVDILPTRDSNASNIFGNNSNGFPIYIKDSIYNQALSTWSSKETNLSNRLKKLSTLSV